MFMVPWLFVRVILEFILLSWFFILLRAPTTAKQTSFCSSRNKKKTNTNKADTHVIRENTAKTDTTIKTNTNSADVSDVMRNSLKNNNSTINNQSTTDWENTKIRLDFDGAYNRLFCDALFLYVWWFTAHLYFFITATQPEKSVPLKAVAFYLQITTVSAMNENPRQPSV